MYKVCVYAICKNEEKFINRWYNSMKEADKIFVLDTGSTDNSYNLLKKLGVCVKRMKIKPWRFDVARNISLDMIDEDCDICVCTDLDEVFEKGWRDKLEKIWNKNITRVSYTYNWSLENNKPLVSFYLDQIHKRHGYKWVRPVHEVLESDNEIKVLEDKIVLNHYPDLSKKRNYLPLLELSVKEDPFDDRNMHYLGREYMYLKKWNKAIDTLICHLNLKTALWKDERCASMRFIGRCYKNLNRYFESEMWYKKAIEEAPYLKEGYAELGIFYYENKEYEKAIFLLEKVLKIKVNYKTYITEYFSTDLYIHDILSICYFNINDFNNSLKHINEALKLDNNERLVNNKKIILNNL